ncbi:hypothetical protein BY996DRAFT_6455852 [Phakopsora pachyrhizi]|nr:hypothetical protein BY996DRAFT_6455852 [Phakopsora pachyrhizi]
MYIKPQRIFPEADFCSELGWLLWRPFLRGYFEDFGFEEQRWDPGRPVNTREILPGVLKILTMQGVLDWIRAGLPQGNGIEGWQMAGVAGGGCGGRIGKRGQGKGGAEGGFCWVLLGFKEEGVAQKLGGGAHQGQSDWIKTTGATDL